MTRPVRVFAPATVSNLGPGFDVLGLALDVPGDVVEAERSERPGVEIVEITGDQGMLTRDPGQNVAGVAAAHVLGRWHTGAAAAEVRRGGSRARIGDQGRRGGEFARGRLSRGVRLRLHKQMPLFSGLGSSAASSVAAGVAVNELLGRPFSREELLESAMEGERVACGAAHADNAAPSLLGGIILIRSYDPLEVVHLPVPDDLWLAVAHPHCALATTAARALLVTQQYSLPQAVGNLGNLGALVSALYQHDLALLGRSTGDQVIEPARAHLIPGFQQVKAAAMAAGALGCSISGAGPSVFALADRRTAAERLAAAMADAFLAAARLQSDVYVSRVNTTGARIC